MTLRIANARSDRIAVDMAGVTPESLAGLSLAEVRRTAVAHGNRRVELGELFTIDGEPGAAAWRLTGDWSAVHAVGAGMAVGEIVVDGPVGRRAGARMRGGKIDILGHAGDGLGVEMRGGAIRVRGNAGHAVGAASLGGRCGMTGGIILIDGNAGDEVGRRMRRGLIAVAGNVGDWLGMRMLAGSIFVFGRCGARPGAALRRGTIGLFGAERPALLPAYRLACRAPLPMLRLVERRLRAEAFAVDRLTALRDAVELHHGDLLELGRGEVLLPASAPLATTHP